MNRVGNKTDKKIDETKVAKGGNGDSGGAGGAGGEGGQGGTNTVKNMEKIVPLVEYLVRRKSGRYQASHPSSYRRSEKGIHKFGIPIKDKA